MTLSSFLHHEPDHAVWWTSVDTFTVLNYIIIVKLLNCCHKLQLISWQLQSCVIWQVVHFHFLKGR